MMYLMLINRLFIIFILTTIIYTFIKSIKNYYKLKCRTKYLYNASIDESEITTLSICSINGTVCNNLRIFTYNTFTDYIEAYKNRFGTIHLITTKDNDSFFNVLQNHLIDRYSIIIDKVGIIPATYIDYIKIMWYILYSDNIILHVCNDKKQFGSPEELYEIHMDTMISLKEMNEFKDVKDIIHINYSTEFNDKKLIWRNNETNILYMHGYDNDPISMLAAIMYHYKSKYDQESISNAINDIVSKFTRNGIERTLFTFMEKNPDKVIQNVISASSSVTLVDIDSIKSVENTWIYNPLAGSIWETYNYRRDLSNKLNSELSENSRNC